MATDGSYILGHGEAERARLDAQGAALEAATRAMLASAGVGPGMRVLDVGCGTGAVTAIAAELVGPTGRVLGVDRSDAGFAGARAALEARGLGGRAGFAVGMLPDLDVDGGWDAVVGRLVMMYMPDPADSLGRLLRLVRPGGIAAFHEISLSSGRSVPELPTVAGTYAAVCEAFRHSGLQEAMGERIAADFVACGLEPSLSVTTFVEVGGGGFLPGVIVGLLRSCMGTVVANGIATEAGIGIDDLEARMRAELDGADAVIRAPEIVGCWARLPG